MQTPRIKFCNWDIISTMKDPSYLTYCLIFWVFFCSIFERLIVFFSVWKVLVELGKNWIRVFVLFLFYGFVNLDLVLRLLLWSKFDLIRFEFLFLRYSKSWVTTLWIMGFILWRFSIKVSFVELILVPSYTATKQRRFVLGKPKDDLLFRYSMCFVMSTFTSRPTSFACSSIAVKASSTVLK